MTNILGFEFPTPNITGLLSQSWTYIFIIALVIVIATISLIILFFFLTWNIKIEAYENIGGGSKLVRVLKTRARRIKIGKGGEELLHLLRPKVDRTAYGRKIAPNTYAFIIGEDGYWRNAIIGDYNLKKGIIEMEPVQQDVRLAYVSIGDMIDREYNPNKAVLIGMSIFLAIMTLIWIVGFYIVLSKFGGISKDFSEASDKFQKVADTQAQTSTIIANAKISNENTINNPQGLTPANSSGS